MFHRATSSVSSNVPSLPAVQNGSTGMIEQFMVSFQRLTGLINGLEAKVDVLNKQLFDLQKRVGHTSARVEDLNKTLLEVLQRERMAMDKFGDIASRFQGGLGSHSADTYME